jgi:peptide chain release factor 2
MKEEHLKIEAFPRRPDKGGQTVGLLDCGIKVTHLPSGLVASCIMERSQLKNKRVAISMIEYGLAEMEWRD